MKSNVRWKRLSAVAMAAALTMTIAMPIALAREEKPSFPELTVAPVRESAGGHIAGGLDQSYYNFNSSYSHRSRAAIPSIYDLRSLGQSTTVKDQDPWGSDWTFGALSSIEGNVLKQTNAEGTAEKATPDYSERHLGWFVFEPQDGEGKQIVGTGSRYDAGGNRFYTTGMLSAWSGPVDEQDAPYLSKKSDDWSLPESLRNKSALHLQNADFLPSPAVFTNPLNNTGYQYDANAVLAIKQAMLDNGVVDMSYYADQSLPGVEGLYITEDNRSQYTYEYRIPNHEVSIVGWDDNYAKTNFKKDHQPPADGAWIVKNSWGSEDWGDNGYFYLSYYDQALPASRLICPATTANTATITTISTTCWASSPRTQRCRKKMLFPLPTCFKQRATRP